MKSQLQQHVMKHTICNEQATEFEASALNKDAAIFDF
jgi:hypothetical protein